MELRASVHVAVPIERAFDVWVDGARYPQWQAGVLAVTDVTGPIEVVGTTFVLDHGPKLKRAVRVVDVERPVRHVIEQEGVGVRDHTVATFEAIQGGTRVTLAIYAHLNRIMRVMNRLDRADRVAREAQAELDRFAAVAIRVPGPARVGGKFVVRAGHARRHVTVLGHDSGRVHIRLHPGTLNERDADDVEPRVPARLSDQLRLDPIPPPIRWRSEVSAQGLPFFLRDGGQGIAHLALTMDAWADAAGRDLGIEAPIADEDRIAVEAWRATGEPAVGEDPGLSLAPVCTLRLGVDRSNTDVWVVAKVLRSEIMRVHLAVFGDRWSTRPEGIKPWEHRLRRMPEGDIEAGAMPDLALGVGHVPLNRSGFSAAKPRFECVTTLSPSELEGYRIWREASGRSFDTLQWMLDWPGSPP